MTLCKNRGMKNTTITATGIPRANTYVPAVQITAPERLLFVSGQIPETIDGQVPHDFASQCRLAWNNILTALEGADMGLENLVKVTIYLSDRRYRDENAAIRDEFMGQHKIALTVVIVGIYESRWLLEIEAVAAG